MSPNSMIDSEISKLISQHDECAYPYNSKELANIGLGENNFFPKIFLMEVFSEDNARDEIFKKNLTKKIPGRQEISNLKKWFDEMKKLYFTMDTSENHLNESKGVLAIAIQELFKQISINCHERGDMLMDIFANYALLINKFVAIHSDRFLNKINEIKTQSEILQSKLKSKIKKLKDNTDNLKNKMRIVEENNEKLTNQVILLEKKMISKTEIDLSELRKRTSISSKRNSALLNYNSISSVIATNNLERQKELISNNYERIKKDLFEKGNELNKIDTESEASSSSSVMTPIH